MWSWASAQLQRMEHEPYTDLSDTSAMMMGDDVTVSCAEGEEGFVYRGWLPVRIERTNPADVSRPRTRMMMNVANPAEAFSLSLLPNDGVGLARLEKIEKTCLVSASLSTPIRLEPEITEQQ